MHFNGLKWCFERVSITAQFLGSKIQNQIVEENSGFECIFFRIEEWVISTPSSQLEKTHQTSEFLLMNDFL